MIRNVVLHISNEQPLLADLYEVPAARDAGMLCTNLRAMDGKRPLFVDNMEATFFFPYRVVRFLEIPSDALERHLAEGRGAAPSDRAAGIRIPGGPESTLPAVIEAPAGDDLGLDMGEEIDEDFLRRIRDI